jgi:hypothetical protein
VLRNRLAIARNHWRHGRACGYPWRCVAHFFIDTVLGWKSAPVRHDPNDVNGRPGVVCGIFHAGASPLPVRYRIIEMLQWQLPYLQPGARGAAFRRAVAPMRWDGPYRWDDPAYGYHDCEVGDPELEWF